MIIDLLCPIYDPLYQTTISCSIELFYVLYPSICDQDTQLYSIHQFFILMYNQLRKIYEATHQGKPVPSSFLQSLLTSFHHCRINLVHKHSLVVTSFTIPFSSVSFFPLMYIIKLLVPTCIYDSKTRKSIVYWKASELSMNCIVDDYYICQDNGPSSTVYHSKKSSFSS